MGFRLGFGMAPPEPHPDVGSADSTEVASSSPDRRFPVRFRKLALTAPCFVSDPLYMIRPRSVSAGGECGASNLPDDLDVCRLSNRKHFDKAASRIDVGRTGGDSVSSRGAAIPEEHVRQPGGAETWTPAVTVKRGETARTCSL